MSDERPGCSFGCPVEAALAVIGGKWKGIILYHLKNDTRRFNELKRLIPGITQRMLTKQLRELEADQVINRKIFQEIPPKVEYSLTNFGLTLTPILKTLQEWGVEYIEKITKIRNKA
ncbi:MAG TPA: transcriptional regulator [Gammaproteobacteria bacterium]|nr:putative HTH-type transcriptional regulator YybR [bacterium BMS3Abin11]GMT40303.1 MAG: MarR family transcriptional regulator [bacterium]HDH16363.1 transcriptional regulator [Gammaproteobacteria bacterium]HDZ77900.1 transcriptional regulator [Gammaproteobacteria bacterium]